MEAAEVSFIRILDNTWTNRRPRSCEREVGVYSGGIGIRIAVIGAGVSGLGAAYVLAPGHDVELFERDARAGGHANTVVHDGHALDTGFLVHNERTYPLLSRLFGELGVRRLEYSGRRPFAPLRNAAAPRFHALLWEIGRWLRTASDDGLDETWSLQRYLDERGYSHRFRHHFLVPLTAALWSTAPGRALEFPAASAIRFFGNHGMLGFGRFRWRTVAGGSRSYVDAVAARLGPRLHVGLGVRELRRGPDGVELRTEDGELRRFDQVVVATHADQALRLLGDPSEQERRVLGAFAYTDNDAVLHTDDALLPRARRARASWNYLLGDDGRPTVTYWLNSLQRIEGETNYCVTLNAPVDEERVIARFRYAHPLYTAETPAAQEELRRLSGERRTHWAGAHLGNGFHEAGLASGVAAAAALGVTW
jgi:predicted NAD/FAD-binding protein